MRMSFNTSREGNRLLKGGKKKLVIGLLRVNLVQAISKALKKIYCKISNSMFPNLVEVLAFVFIRLRPGERR